MRVLTTSVIPSIFFYNFSAIKDFIALITFEAWYIPYDKQSEFSLNSFCSCTFICFFSTPDTLHDYSPFRLLHPDSHLSGLGTYAVIIYMIQSTCALSLSRYPAGLLSSCCQTGDRGRGGKDLRLPRLLHYCLYRHCCRLFRFHALSRKHCCCIWAANASASTQAFPHSRRH